MKALALMYHDVVEPGGDDASGFPGRDAALYKLERADFAAHLRALAESVPTAPVSVEGLSSSTSGRTPWLLTFDDGGVSAYTHAAEALEARGWRGHFLITTSFIGKRGFVNAAQLRELYGRGHIIGAHSHSHPMRMSACSNHELRDEWETSVARLSDILGAAVQVASVPGGHFSRRVAEVAAHAGVTDLFTSEPTAQCQRVDGCLIVGRYAIQRWTPPQTAAALAAGRVAPRLRQALLWNAKKATKSLGGEAYLRLRLALLGERAQGNVSHATINDERASAPES